jgi:hypothetical protein
MNPLKQEYHFLHQEYMRVAADQLSLFGYATLSSIAATGFGLASGSNLESYYTGMAFVCGTLTTFFVPGIIAGSLIKSNISIKLDVLEERIRNETELINEGNL